MTTFNALNLAGSVDDTIDAVRHGARSILNGLLADAYKINALDPCEGAWNGLVATMATKAMTPRTAVDAAASMAAMAAAARMDAALDWTVVDASVEAVVDLAAACDAKGRPWTDRKAAVDRAMGVDLARCVAMMTLDAQECGAAVHMHGHKIGADIDINPRRCRIDVTAHRKADWPAVALAVAMIADKCEFCGDGTGHDLTITAVYDAAAVED
jgi:hypothetical protein